MPSGVRSSASIDKLQRMVLESDDQQPKSDKSHPEKRSITFGKGFRTFSDNQALLFAADIQQLPAINLSGGSPSVPEEKLKYRL